MSVWISGSAPQKRGRESDGRRYTDSVRCQGRRPFTSFSFFSCPTPAALSSFSSAMPRTVPLAMQYEEARAPAAFGGRRHEGEGGGGGVCLPSSSCLSFLLPLSFSFLPSPPSFLLSWLSFLSPFLRSLLFRTRSAVWGSGRVLSVAATSFLRVPRRRFGAALALSRCSYPLRCRRGRSLGTAWQCLCCALAIATPLSVFSGRPSTLPAAVVAAAPFAARSVHEHSLHSLVIGAEGLQDNPAYLSAGNSTNYAHGSNGGAYDEFEPPTGGSDRRPSAPGGRACY